MAQETWDAEYKRVLGQLNDPVSDDASREAAGPSLRIYWEAVAEIQISLLISISLSDEMVIGDRGETATLRDVERPYRRRLVGGQSAGRRFINELLLFSPGSSRSQFGLEEMGETTANFARFVAVMRGRATARETARIDKNAFAPSLALLSEVPADSLGFPLSRMASRARIGRPMRGDNAQRPDDILSIESPLELAGADLSGLEEWLADVVAGGALRLKELAEWNARTDQR